MHPAIERLAALHGAVYTDPIGRLEPSPLAPYCPEVQEAAGELERARLAWEAALSDFGIADSAVRQSVRAVDATEDPDEIAGHLEDAEKRLGLAEAWAVIAQRRAATVKRCASAYRGAADRAAKAPGAEVVAEYLEAVLGRLEGLHGAYAAAVAVAVETAGDLDHEIRSAARLLRKSDPVVASRLMTLVAALPDSNMTIPALRRSVQATRPEVVRAVATTDSNYMPEHHAVLTRDGGRQYSVPAGDVA